LAGLALVALLAPLEAQESRAPRPLGTAHLRDPGAVAALAFVASGSLILSGDSDGGFVIREAATRHVLSSFSPVGSAALRFPCFAFAPDGTRVFAAALGGTEVVVRDARSGALVERVPLGASVRELACSPDGTLVAARIEDGVWLLPASGGEPAARKLEVARPFGLSFSPDRVTLVVGGADALHFFDARSGQESRKSLAWKKKRDGDEKDDDEPHLGSHAPASIAWSPDRKWLATAGGRSIRVWDLEAGELDFEHETDDFVGQIVFSPDSKRIATGGEDEFVHIVSLSKQKEIGKLEGHGNSVTGVAYSPDGKILVSGSKDASVRAWEAKKGESLEEFSGHSGAIASVSFSKDGTRVVTAADDRRVLVWETSTGKLAEELDGSRAVFSPDGKALARQKEKEIVIRDGEGDEHTITLTSPLELVGFTFDSKEVVTISDEKRPRVIVYGAKDGEESSQVRLGRAAVRKCVLSPARPALYFLDAARTLHVADLEAASVEGFAGDTTATDLALSPDGSELAILDDAGQLRVLDAKTGAERRALGPAAGPLAFGPGEIWAGNTVFSAEGSRSFGVRPTVVAVSPDGKLAATGDAGGGAWVWPLK
jgi:WD40 repeat protein